MFTSMNVNPLIKCLQSGLDLIQQDGDVSVIRNNAIESVTLNLFFLDGVTLTIGHFTCTKKRIKVAQTRLDRYN